jgi:hypothetical protein
MASHLIEGELETSAATGRSARCPGWPSTSCTTPGCAADAIRLAAPRRRRWRDEICAQKNARELQRHDAGPDGLDQCGPKGGDCFGHRQVQAAFSDAASFGVWFWSVPGSRIARPVGMASARPPPRLPPNNGATPHDLWACSVGAAQDGIDLYEKVNRKQAASAGKNGCQERNGNVVLMPVRKKISMARYAALKRDLTAASLRKRWRPISSITQRRQGL